MLSQYLIKIRFLSKNCVQMKTPGYHSKYGAFMRLWAAEYWAVIRVKINGDKGRDKFKINGGKRRGKF